MAGRGEHVTGSLERVSLEGPDHEALIAQVRDAAFPLALRGYDREAVDAYVKRVNRLITDLEASRSPEAAIRRALDQVGEETSGILQRAQQTANDITERSRASADDRIREAEREARAITEDAEDHVRELEADYGEIWARRDSLLEQVRDLAERLLATADDAAERFPTQDEEAADASHDDTNSFPAVEPRVEEPVASSPRGVEPTMDLEREGSASPLEDPAPFEPGADGTGVDESLDGDEASGALGPDADEDTTLSSPDEADEAAGADEADFGPAPGETTPPAAGGLEGSAPGERPSP